MMLLVVVVLGLVVVAQLAFLAWRSQTPPALGLVDGHLRACSAKPNCVNSEAPGEDGEHAIAPFAHADWASLRQAIEACGGTVDQDDGHYLHATFTSRLFRFVDDVELRRDAAHDLVQVRSASRVGQSDLGVNRKRIESIRSRLAR